LFHFLGKILQLFRHHRLQHHTHLPGSEALRNLMNFFSPQFQLRIDTGLISHICKTYTQICKVPPGFSGVQPVGSYDTWVSDLDWWPRDGRTQVRAKYGRWPRPRAPG
jgi:hypothetical protein